MPQDRIVLAAAGGIGDNLGGGMFEAITRSRLDILVTSAVMAAACATNAFYRRTG